MTGRVSLPVICLGILGFGVLYVPMPVITLFSFKDGRLVSVWQGFETK